VDGRARKLKTWIAWTEMDQNDDGPQTADGEENHEDYYNLKPVYRILEGHLGQGRLTKNDLPITPDSTLMYTFCSTNFMISNEIQIFI
jgi:hypothetical protein